MQDPLQYLFGLEPIGIKFGLENITSLVESLGHPERAFRSVHVAGTNGKGSVTAMVDAALRAARRRSARYTSPHLVDIRERFVIDGRPVTEEALAGVISYVRDRIESLRAAGALDVQPTFFVEKEGKVSDCVASRRARMSLRRRASNCSGARESTSP